MSQAVPLNFIKKSTTESQRTSHFQKDHGKNFDTYVQTAVQHLHKGDQKQTSTDKQKLSHLPQKEQDSAKKADHHDKKKVQQGDGATTGNPINQLNNPHIQQLISSLQQLINHLVGSQSENQPAKSEQIMSDLKTVMNILNGTNLAPVNQKAIADALKAAVTKQMTLTNNGTTNNADSALENLNQTMSMMLKEMNQKNDGVSLIKDVIGNLTQMLNQLNHGRQKNSIQPKSAVSAMNVKDSNLGSNNQSHTTQTTNGVVKKLNSKVQQVLASTSISQKTNDSSKGNNLNQGAVFNSGPMHRLQQLMVHNQNVPQPVNNSHIIQQIQEALAKNGLTQLKTGGQQLNLQLHPDHLGELNIVITQDQGGISAKIATTTTDVKDLIQSQIGQLRQAFAAHNLPVNKVEVYNQSQFNLSQQPQQQQQHQQQQEQNQQEQAQQYYLVNDHEGDSASQDFSDWLRNGLKGESEVRV